MMRKVWFAFVGCAAILAVVAWVSDFFSLQGNIRSTPRRARKARGPATVAPVRSWPGRGSGFGRCGGTAKCSSGRWEDPNPPASSHPCAIEDGKNWSCAAGAEASRSMTPGLDEGQPSERCGGSSRANCRVVRKWVWLLLRWGVFFGATAPKG